MEGIRRAIQAPQFLCATRDKITWPEKWKQRKEQATSSILEEIVSSSCNSSVHNYAASTRRHLAAMQDDVCVRVTLTNSTVNKIISTVVIEKYVCRYHYFTYVIRDENCIEFGKFGATKFKYKLTLNDIMYAYVACNNKCRACTWFDLISLPAFFCFRQTFSPTLRAE